MGEETNTKAVIDPFHWDRLSQFHPTDVCNRTEAIYHPPEKAFYCQSIISGTSSSQKKKRFCAWNGTINPLRNHSILISL